MRSAVIAVPSRNAVGSPVSGSNAAMTAWWVGSVVFCGKTLTSLLVSASEDGTRAGIAREERRALRDLRRDPGRGRRPPGAQVGHRGCERLDELVEVEEPLDLGAAEDQHPPTLSVGGEPSGARLGAV